MIATIKAINPEVATGDLAELSTTWDTGSEIVINWVLKLKI